MMASGEQDGLSGKLAASVLTTWSGRSIYTLEALTWCRWCGSIRDHIPSPRALFVVTFKTR